MGSSDFLVCELMDEYIGISKFVAVIPSLFGRTLDVQNQNYPSFSPEFALKDGSLRASQSHIACSLRPY
jgi:hypothetical protein